MNMTLILGNILIIGTLLIICTLRSKKQLKRLVAKKTAEINTLFKTFDKNVIASTTDAKGVIIFVSKAFCTVSGYEESELIGKSHSIVRHPDMPKSAFKEMWKTIKEGAIWQGEVKNLKKDGSFYWVEVIITPEKTSHGIIYNAIRQDITNKKEIEELRLHLDLKTKDIIVKNNKLKQLSDKLSKYLSPQIYEMIFSEESNVITSKRKKLTIFFSDIVNFTATTESLESEELTNMINDYLTEMSNIALEYGATIDKYIGDAIVIFFGDPQSDGYKEDARKCVSMAIAMQKKMDIIERKYINDGVVNSFKIRMGINTSYVTVGNFGSSERMDYTIIGGGVNLAARLESSAEPKEILISHETYSLVQNSIKVTKQKLIKVKGISKEVQTYKVEGFKNQPKIDDLELVADALYKFKDKKDIIKKLRDVIIDLEK